MSVLFVEADPEGRVQLWSSHGPATPLTGGSGLATLRHEAHLPAKWARPQGADGLWCVEAGLDEGGLWPEWETRLWQGRPLGNTHVVVRTARPCFDPAPPPRTGPLVLFSLFPRAQWPFAAFEQEARQAGAFVRLRAGHSRTFWAEQLSHAREAVILAHADAQGLHDEEGRPFALDTTVPWPPVVWLLACNTQQTLYRLAGDLLGAGVRTVITATQALDAPTIEALLCAWLSRPLGQSLETWLLLQRRATPLLAGGVHALTVFGEVFVGQGGPEDLWNAAWRRHQATGFRLADQGKDAFATAKGLLASPPDGLWPSTRHWLFPELIKAAEKYDHGALSGHYAQVKALPDTHSKWDALAKYHYRKGDYPEMAAALLRAKALETDSVQRAETGLRWMNLMLDMHQLNAVRSLLDAAEAVVFDDPHHAEVHRLKCVDIRARLALREHRFALALGLFERKQHKSPHLGPAYTEEGRETAWCLYAAAWGVFAQQINPETAWAKADAVLMALEHSGPVPEKGNDPAAYWLRALSAWHAVASHHNPDEGRVQALRETVLSHAPRIRAGLCQRVDTGPFAFAVLFGHWALPALPIAERELAYQALYDEQYFLEMAGFASLLGDNAQKRRALAALARLHRTMAQALDGPEGAFWPAEPVPDDVWPIL